MFGAIKKIFKRGGSGSQESSAQTQAVAEQETYSNEAPAAEPVVDYSAADSAAAAGDSLRVTLKALVPYLPKELQGKNPPRSDEALILPKHQVLEQLAQGAVKVPFGQVRRIASVGVLAGGSSHDSRMVDVPLKEILAQLRGEGFPRRPDQRTIQIPEEIQDIFGSKGEARAQMRIMQKDEVKQGPRSEQQPAQAAVSEPPLTPIPLYQKPTAASLGAAPAQQQSRSPASSPPPAAAPRPAAMQPIQRGEFLAFNLAEISANWPEPVKREIQRLGAQNSKCLLATAEIQEALKQGRVSYTWGQISGRLQPALAAHAQVQNDQTILELPISAVASAFFTQTQATNANASRPAVKPPTNIEPLFRGGPGTPPQQQQPIPRPAPPPPQPSAPAPPRAPIQPPPQLRMQQDPPLQPQQPISAPAMAQPAAPPRPAMGPSKGNVTFKVSDVTSGWPEELKKEVNKLHIASSKVAIPFEWIEPGLRTGKIEFTWAEFCGFVEGCAQQMQSPLAANRVSLPLPVLAPLCLRLSPPTQRKAATYDDIPDIFGPGGTPSPGAPPAPAPAARPAPPRPPPPRQEEEEEEEEETPIFQKASSRPAATPPPQPTYTPQPPPTPAAGRAPAQIDAGTNAKNLAELFGEPGKRNWTPNEIVQRTAQLPGVAGALIALQDGLLVANCMPQGWKTETIAAFLPQIFGRMSQYVKELSMGDLISVTVSVEQGTLQVYKAGIIYFAALARPDTILPLAALNLIARELSRHTK